MSNKIDPPTTWQEEREEIDEWIEERNEDARDDFEELMEDIDRLREADDYALTIAGFWQGTWLP